MAKTILKILVGVLLLTGGVFLLGPKAKYEAVNPDLPSLGIALEELEDYVAQQNLNPEMKPGNGSLLIWADSVRKTEYALVYLHGFSASPMEGDPLHEEVAQRYGMNFYAPRLAKHGLKGTEAFLDLTPTDLMDAAKEALAVGQILGEKVILMSCSTGGTLAMYLSAKHPSVAANILYSPNIKIYDPTAPMMTGPWGDQILRSIVGDYRTSPPEDKPKAVQEKIDQYWYNSYRVEGLIALQDLLDQTMTDEVFNDVTQPYLLGYYYKNDTAQDMTVSVDAMLEFDEKSGTPSDKKRTVAFPEAGAHVIASPLQSSAVLDVRQATFDFIEEVLKLDPK